MSAWTFLADLMLKILTDEQVCVVAEPALPLWWTTWVNDERSARGLAEALFITSAQMNLLKQTRLLAGTLIAVEPLLLDGCLIMQAPSEAALRMIYECFATINER